MRQPIPCTIVPMITPCFALSGLLGSVGCELGPTYPGDVPRVAFRSTLGFLMLPRWGVRGNAPRLGSLFAKTHEVVYYVDEFLLVDELLQVLRHQGFLLLLQLVKLAGWNRPLDPFRVLDAHRLRCPRD